MNRNLKQIAKAKRHIKSTDVSIHASPNKPLFTPPTSTNIYCQLSPLLSHVLSPRNGLTWTRDEAKDGPTQLEKGKMKNSDAVRKILSVFFSAIRNISPQSVSQESEEA